MKILSYDKTPKGKLLLVSITDPCVDVLESKVAAVKKTTATSDFKELTASIELYNKFVKKCRADNVRFADPSSVPEHVMKELKLKLAAVMAKQQKMAAMEAQEMSDNPIFLLPGQSVFIADELAEEIIEAKQDIHEDTLVVIELSRGKVVAWEVRPNILGKLYRLPDSPDWLKIEEPDEIFPDTAVFEEPDVDELNRIEAGRIEALAPDSRASEKAALIVGAKNVLMRETIASELEGTPDAVKAAKDAADEDYKATLSGLQVIYG